MGAKPALLAGGNPQIAKADSDAPVQAYIAAMPGWKRDVGRHLDVLIVRTVPDARKAARLNSPFSGIEGQGWFVNFHCFRNVRTGHGPNALKAQMLRDTLCGHDLGPVLSCRLPLQQHLSRGPEPFSSPAVRDPNSPFASK